MHIDRIHRYAVAVSAAELIPIPLLDTVVQNALRRRLVRGEGVEEESRVRALADAPVLDVRRLLTWPMRKLLGKIALPYTLARAARDTVELGLRVRTTSPATTGS